MLVLEQQLPFGSNHPIKIHVPCLTQKDFTPEEEELSCDFVLENVMVKEEQ